MNIERLTVLRDYLANPPADHEFGFNMLGWAEETSLRYPDLLSDTAVGSMAEAEHECGTVFCIAGLAIALYPDCSKKIKFCDQGAEVLGLEHSQAWQLFYGGHISLDEITVPMAIGAIDRLITTGEVTWRREDG